MQRVSALDVSGLFVPGIYPGGVLNYDAVQAVNQSSLKEILVSPKQYAYRLRQPLAVTDSMARGLLVHTAVLEPHRLQSAYAVWEGERRYGKDWDAFESAAKAQGKVLVRRTDMESAKRIAESVLSDPLGSYYFRGSGQNEPAILWKEPSTGLPCKARVDRITAPDGAPFIVDLKVVSDISPMGVARVVANYGYHLQGAFYSDAYEVVTGQRPTFLIAAVEAREPYDVVIYQLEDQAIDQGRDEYRTALGVLAECVRADSWPGLGRGQVQSLQLPAWKRVADDGDDLADLDVEP